MFLFLNHLFQVCSSGSTEYICLGYTSHFHSLGNQLRPATKYNHYLGIISPLKVTALDGRLSWGIIN